VKFRARLHSAVAYDEGNGKHPKVTKVHRNTAFVGELCHLRRTMTRYLFRPVSHTVQRGRIYQFSVNFLRFAWFFEKGFSSIMMAVSQSSLFAASRLRVRLNPRPAARRAVGWVHAKARRREEEGIALARIFFRHIGKRADDHFLKHADINIA
jgi:hypothetical protein